MPVWSDLPRPDPEPCRAGDEGLFEVTVRDGRARLGKLHTKHGILTTPALLPVINPNIRTIEPREMWDRYGIGALITNSYIIRKHPELSDKALKDGVHALLDYPGVVMTDSGTFQAYVYGDIDVGVDEIVEFQRNIGVDIATMLDVFSRPDMTHSEVQNAVMETINRSEISIHSAQGTMLNGPIQGGIYPELREISATEMAKYSFAVHPIGGIVPVMEQQRYRDYAKIMLATLPFLPPNRPVHMFGCGHPMLFPMSIALGADLFDSAAYALFARDGRILTPWGTERLDGLVEWPIITPCITSYSPDMVRSLPNEEQIALLSKYNLEITLAELSRCRQAVRDGKIWRLVEQRSHMHPALRDAFLWLTTNPATSHLIQQNRDAIPLDETTSSQDVINVGRWETAWNWILDAQQTPRKGGEQWAGSDTDRRPHIITAKNLLKNRWHPSNSSISNDGSVLIFYGQSGPWRDKCDSLVAKLIKCAPDIEIMVDTPIGLVPYTLEDLNPFCHIEGPSWVWTNHLDMAKLATELEQFGLGGRGIIPIDLRSENFEVEIFAKLSDYDLMFDIDLVNNKIMILDDEAFNNSMIALNRRKARDKLAVLFNTDQETANELTSSMEFVVNKHGRIKNLLSPNGEHLASFRLGDGGLSLANFGAIELFNRRRRVLPSGFTDSSIGPYSGEGLAVVVVDDDAVPFVRKGRNVFHGFVLASDPWLRPGEACFICSVNGELIGHGVSCSTSVELATMRKGVAIKTRDGIKPDI